MIWPLQPTGCQIQKGLTRVTLFEPGTLQALGNMFFVPMWFAGVGGPKERKKIFLLVLFFGGYHASSCMTLFYACGKLAPCAFLPIPFPNKRANLPSSLANPVP